MQNQRQADSRLHKLRLCRMAPDQVSTPGFPPYRADNVQTRWAGHIAPHSTLASLRTLPAELLSPSRAPRFPRTPTIPTCLPLLSHRQGHPTTPPRVTPAGTTIHTLLPPPPARLCRPTPHNSLPTLLPPLPTRTLLPPPRSHTSLHQATGPYRIRQGRGSLCPHPGSTRRSVWRRRHTTLLS